MCPTTCAHAFGNATCKCDDVTTGVLERKRERERRRTRYWIEVTSLQHYDCTTTMTLRAALACAFVLSSGTNTHTHIHTRARAPFRCLSCSLPSVGIHLAETCIALACATRTHNHRCSTSFHCAVCRQTAARRSWLSRVCVGQACVLSRDDDGHLVATKLILKSCRVETTLILLSVANATPYRRNTVILHPNYSGPRDEIRDLFARGQRDDVNTRRDR